MVTRKKRRLVLAGEIGGQKWRSGGKGRVSRKEAGLLVQGLVARGLKAMDRSPKDSLVRRNWFRGGSATWIRKGGQMADKKEVKNSLWKVNEDLDGSKGRAELTKMIRKKTLWMWSASCTKRGTSQ